MKTALLRFFYMGTDKFRIALFPNSEIFFKYREINARKIRIKWKAKCPANAGHSYRIIKTCCEPGYRKYLLHGKYTSSNEFGDFLQEQHNIIAVRLTAAVQISIEFALCLNLSFGISATANVTFPNCAEAGVPEDVVTVEVVAAAVVVVAEFVFGVKALYVR